MKLSRQQKRAARRKQNKVEWYKQKQTTLNKKIKSDLIHILGTPKISHDQNENLRWSWQLFKVFFIVTFIDKYSVFHIVRGQQILMSGKDVYTAACQFAQDMEMIMTLERTLGEDVIEQLREDVDPEAEDVDINALVASYTEIFRPLTNNDLQFIKVVGPFNDIASVAASQLLTQRQEQKNKQNTPETEQQACEDDDCDTCETDDTSATDAEMDASDADVSDTSETDTDNAEIDADDAGTDTETDSEGSNE